MRKCKVICQSHKLGAGAENQLNLMVTVAELLPVLSICG